SNDTLSTETYPLSLHDALPIYAEDLPFADGSFDLVTCRIAPHHFADVQRAVHEVARVLRPGGLFLLIDSVAPEDPELDEFLNERSEEHTSELQSRENLVCRLLL